MHPVPIHVVRPDARVERLGEWRPAEHRLVLEREGFPLLGVGEHVIEADLPWVFYEMCPSGFLGRAFARRYPELNLGADPARWSAQEVLRALSQHGSDLPGNLILGDASLEEFKRRQTEPDFEIAEANELLTAQQAAAATEGASNVGGERPKLVFGSWILKYSPPVNTLLGTRWQDLLRTEGHCAQTLRAQGVAAVEVRLYSQPLGGREYLAITRFDRSPSGTGRVGATTLYWYAMERMGDPAMPAPRVVETLVRDGHLQPVELETCERTHAFSAAIGNTDAHLANYGLLWDERGRPSLAPMFDVLPMALAPRHDELPDAYLQPRTQSVDPTVRSWVQELASRIGADPVISPGFKVLWRRYVGL